MQKTRQEVIQLVLETARKEVGTKEDPPYSNKTKYNRWFYNSNLGVPWCATFLSWCFHEALGTSNIKFENCEAWMQSHKNYKTYIDPSKKPEIGDIVFMAFSSNDIANKNPAHVGIVEGIALDGRIKTIEGNTSDSKSQDNGGEVMQKLREINNIVGYGRHNFLTQYELGKGKN